MTKAKLRKKIRRLKRENLQLIIECNAAMARAGEAHEAAQEARTMGTDYYYWRPAIGKLDG